MRRLSVDLGVWCGSPECWTSSKSKVGSLDIKQAQNQHEPTPSLQCSHWAELKA